MNLLVIAPRGHETLDGIYWSGVLVVDGQRVLRFENRGDGGCLNLDWKPGVDRKPIEKAVAALAPTVDFEAFDAGIGTLWDTAMMASAA